MFSDKHSLLDHFSGFTQILIYLKKILMAGASTIVLMLLCMVILLYPLRAVSPVPSPSVTPATTMTDPVSSSLGATATVIVVVIAVVVIAGK